MPIFILDTIFTVPGLPTAPTFGFSDNFNRVNSSSPGYTSSGGKQWKTISAGATVAAGIENNAFYVSRSGTSTHAVVVADAGIPDGIFTVKIAETGDHIGGLAMRVESNANTQLVLSTRYQAGNNRYELRDMVGGAVTSLGVSSVVSATNDIIEVTLNGGNVTVKINGATQITATTTLRTGTNFGFHANIGTTIRYDDVSFLDA